jgi:predicted porin
VSYTNNITLEEGLAMLTTMAPRLWFAALAGVLAIACYPTPSRAADDPALKEQIRILKQRIDELNQQVDALAKKQEQQAAAAAAAAAKPAAAPAVGPPAEPKFEAFAKEQKEKGAEPKLAAFLKGFYGTLDVSIDETTKGMSDFVAYPWTSLGVAGGPPYSAGPPKGGGAPPFGRVGWLAAMSSNGSNVGYRGQQKIGKSDVDLIYQISTSLNMVAAPGLQNTWTKSSNTVQGAIGLGDTYLGFQGKEWGKLKFGEMLMPYRTSTDRLNPFAGQLGDYGVVMGNTGGDNRVEFGTRMDHVVMYNSPTWQGVSFDAAYAFGQNPDPNNNITPLGSPDCTGANNPGSGNLFLNCDDGGFNWAFSADLKYETGPLYLTAAYEIHSKVNRSSDGIGSNSPYYAILPGATNGCTSPVNSPLLDCADFLAFAAEFPGAAAVSSAPYSTAFDVADEWAMKVGGQYRFDFGLTVSYFWEEMHRSVPDVMQFQNERQRTGDWLALDWALNGGNDRIAIGWAHAGATPGDPAGQHNFNPTLLGNNQANMYTLAYWHKFDKQLTYYLDVVDTVNDGNAHYDIGAGTHGIKTDCHDATHAMFIDYSSAGPTTWGGCHPIGVSTGLNYKF